MSRELGREAELAKPEAILPHESRTAQGEAMDDVRQSKAAADRDQDVEKDSGAAHQSADEAVKPSASTLTWPGTVRPRRWISEVGLTALERAALACEPAQKGTAAKEQAQTAVPILLIMGRRKSAAEVDRLISASGHPVLRERSIGKAAQQALGFRLKCMVVHVDSCGSPVQVIDDLVSLREERPNLTVVVVSKGVKRDDFSLERLAMCDVTLRLPAGPEDLEFALQEARINNRVWVMRCRQRKLESAASTMDMKNLLM